MPLYVYRCTRCGNEKELLRKSHERDDVVICEGRTNADGFVQCNQQMERAAPRIAYPGVVDTRHAHLENASNKINHPRGGPR